MEFDLYKTLTRGCLLKWITYCFLSHAWSDMPSNGELLLHHPRWKVLLCNLGEVFEHAHSSLLETKQWLGQGKHWKNDLAGKYVINKNDLAYMLVWACVYDGQMITSKSTKLSMLGNLLEGWLYQCYISLTKWTHSNDILHLFVYTSFSLAKLWAA